MNQAAVIKLIPELFWKSIRYEFEIVAFFFMELRFCEKIKIDPSFVLWIGTTMPFLKASSFDKGFLQYKKIKDPCQDTKNNTAIL